MAAEFGRLWKHFSKMHIVERNTINCANFFYYVELINLLEKGMTVTLYAKVKKVYCIFLQRRNFQEKII